MEKHCISLELAKQMKEAGWQKETEFWWKGRKDDMCIRHKTYIKCMTAFWKDRNIEGEDNPIGEESYPAPLATEILEELQTYLVSINCDIDRYDVIFDGDFYQEESDKSLPNALAKMWLYLRKEIRGEK
jgi:hypothetical protein